MGDLRRMQSETCKGRSKKGGRGMGEARESSGMSKGFTQLSFSCLVSA